MDVYFAGILSIPAEFFGEGCFVAAGEQFGLFDPLIAGDAPFEAAQFGAQRHRGQRIKLLDPHQVDIVEPARVAFGQKVEIDLARAQDDALDLVVGL